jgi:LysR family transcriptional regulator for bpeEF and oprC
VRAEIDRGELVPLLGDFDPPGVPISLLYAPNRQRSANVRAFIDATKAALSGLG